MCVKACKKLFTDLQDRKSVVAGLNIIIDTGISVEQLHAPKNCCQKCNENLKRKKNTT